MPNLQKWVNLSFLACGILAWVLLREVFRLGFTPLGLARPTWIIPPADIVAIALGFIIFIGLLRWTKANNFLAEVLAELSKVSWPARKETLLSTVVVVVLLAIATSCILLFDTFWDWVVGLLLY